MEIVEIWQNLENNATQSMIFLPHCMWAEINKGKPRTELQIKDDFNQVGNRRISWEDPRHSGVPRQGEGS